MEVSHTTLLQLRPELSGADIVVVPPCAAHEQANPAPAATTEFGLNFMFMLYSYVCSIHSEISIKQWQHLGVLLCDHMCSSL